MQGRGDPTLQHACGREGAGGGPLGDGSRPGLHDYLRVRQEHEMANKQPSDESKIHHGHRLRLLDTMINAGIENMSEVQAMEFILFYIFPRGDVNPLAHRLLDKFGSVSQVLDADIEELKEVSGMGDRSSKGLKMLGEIFFYYTQNKLSNKIVLETYSQLTDYFEELMRMDSTERFFIVGLDSSFKVIRRKMLAVGSVKNVGISPLLVTNFVSSSKPAYIIFAHSHPGGKAVPSSQDIKANEKLYELIKCLGVDYVDHIIVGEDGVYSMKKKEYLRKFI